MCKMMVEMVIKMMTFITINKSMQPRPEEADEGGEAEEEDTIFGCQLAGGSKGNHNRPDGQPVYMLRTSCLMQREEA